MKTFKKILAIVSVAAIASVGFAACAPDANANVPPEHTHTYAEGWKFDEQHHWHEATCEHTWLKGGEASHSFTEHKEGEETCTEGVEVTRTCTCGYTYTYTSSPLGHDYQPEEGEDASCSKPGFTDYLKCTRCGDEINKKDIPQLQHNYHYEAVTEDEEGNPIDKHHEVCGFCKEEKAGSLKNHTYKFEVVVDKDGNHTDKHHEVCPLCGAEKADSTADHTHEENKYDHDDSGHWFLCDDCGEPLTSTKTAHSFDPLTGYCACGAMEADHKDYFTYEANGNDLAVTGLIAELDNKTAFAIPETHDGKNVTAIAAGAFAGNTALTKLILPASVKTIGDFAFQGCTALQEIELPGVTALGTFDYQVFNGCSALKAITLPKGVTKIGQSIFLNCKELATVTVEGSVTFIDTQAFYGCTKLEGITLTADLTYIGQKAFANSGVKTLEVKLGSNGRIAQGAFDGCKDLTTLSITGGINYFASPILSGCVKLQTLTLPFIGNHKEADKATDTHFGYIFGKTEDAYDIPTTLSTVNIKGGSVQRGAFADCGAIAVNADDGVEVLTKDFKGYTGTFTWNGNLPGPTVTASVDKQTIFVEETVTLTYEAGPNYEAPNTTSVTVTVKKGAAEAVLNTDYTVADKVYTFKTQGEYTIVVTATYNGVEESAEAKVTVDVHGPNLSDITASGDTYDNGLCNIEKAITLSFTFDGKEETEISYAVKKGDAVAEKETDYTLDEASKTITFKTFGAYTVEVTAVRNDKSETKSIAITATSPDAEPFEVTLTANTADLTEGDDAIELSVDAKYAEGDAHLRTSYTVFVKQGGDTYSNANEEYYELEGNSFKALVAGDYKITVTIISKNGGSGTADLAFTVGAVDLTEKLSVKAEDVNGWIRAKFGEELTVNYEIADNAYVGGYNVTFDKDIADASIEAGTGNSVKLSLNEANTVIYKVIYTHKVVADKVFTLEIPVSFVSDVDKAPVLGEDPFNATGGVAHELLNSTAIQLYWDITDQEDAQLGITDVTFTALGNVDNKEIKFYHVAGDTAKTWYMIFEDFSDGHTTGTIPVKITATKDGETAAATQLFTITALENPDEPAGINAYLDKIMPDGRGAIDAENWRNKMGRTVRENSMFSKDGVTFLANANQGWQPDWTSAITISIGEDKDNFQVDFVLDYVTKAGGDELFVLTDLGLDNAWINGDITFYVNPNDGNWPNKLQCTGIDSNGKLDEDEWESNGKPDTAKPIHMRLTHTVADGKATFVWEWSSEDEPTTYNRLYKYSFTQTDQADNNGSRITGLVFRYRHNCYSISNVQVTNLDVDA